MAHHAFLAPGNLETSLSSGEPFNSKCHTLQEITKIAHKVARENMQWEVSRQSPKRALLNGLREATSALTENHISIRSTCALEKSPERGTRTNYGIRPRRASGPIRIPGPRSTKRRTRHGPIGGTYPTTRAYSLLCFGRGPGNSWSQLAKIHHAAFEEHVFALQCHPEDIKNFILKWPLAKQAE